MKKNLKLAMVTAYPPSKTTLNEYGFYLSKHLAKKKEVDELYLITEKMLGERYESDEEKITFFPCWKFNDHLNPIKILKQLRKLKPDAVIINLQFLLFGDKKLPAALGLMLPILLKLFGIKTIVLLHNIMEEVDLEKAGITKNPVLKGIFTLMGNIMTRFILTADLVGVTIDKYVDTLKKKYKKKNVVLLPHGTFEVPAKPRFTDRKKVKNIMTFGKFGTYKKVEILIDAFVRLREMGMENIELTIAGTDNPNVPGYLHNVRCYYHHVDGINFTGYVEEEDVPKIFGESSVVVFPYTSTTGSSGVLHQTGSYGKAAILPDLGDLGRLIQEEGYGGAFFEPGNTDSLVKAMHNLLTDDQERKKLAMQNYEAASSLPLEDITDWYLLHVSNLLAA